MTFAIHIHSIVRPALFSGLIATLASVSPAAAQNNVSLENLRIVLPEGKSTLTIPRVEFTNTNLSRDELARLFSSEVTKDDARALLSRMKADRVSIPEAVLSEKESRTTLGPLLATGIVEGRFQKASLGGFKGTFTSEKIGEGTVTSGPLELEDGNMAGLLAAAGAGNPAGGDVRLGRISWTGVEATFPDKDTPKSAPGGNLWHVRLGSLTAGSTYDGAVPLKSTGEIRGLVIEPPKASTFGQSLDAFGYQRIDLGFTVAASYDRAARTLTVQDHTITGEAAGALSLSALFGSLDPAIFTSAGPQRAKAMADSDVSQLQAKFVNRGLMEKTLAYFAAQQKKSVEAVKAEWSAMATQIVPIMLGGDPSSLALAQSLQSYIADPRSLTIMLKARGAAVPIAQLQSIKDAATFLALVDVTAKANE